MNIKYLIIILLLFLVCPAYGEDRDTMYWEIEVDTAMECPEGYELTSFGGIKIIKPRAPGWPYRNENTIIYQCVKPEILDTNPITPITTIDTVYQRNDRWTFTVDTVEVEQGTMGGMIVSTTIFDTTWIPLAPVFVDTTKKVDTQILVYPDYIIDSIPAIVYPGQTMSDSIEMHRQADKSMREAEDKCKINWDSLDAELHRAIDRIIEKMKRHKEAKR